MRISVESIDFISDFSKILLVEIFEKIDEVQIDEKNSDSFINYSNYFKWL